MFHYLYTECPNVWGVSLSEARIFPRCWKQIHKVSKNLVACSFGDLFPKAEDLRVDKPQVQRDLTKSQLAAFECFLKAYEILTDDKLSYITDVKRIKTGEKERVLNVKIARHILAPLLGDNGYCVLNNSHAGHIKKKNFNQLKIPGDMDWKGLYVGNAEALYGELDMLAVPAFGEESSSSVVTFGKGYSSSEAMGDDDETNTEEEGSSYSSSEAMGDDDETNTEEEGSNSPGNTSALEGKVGGSTVDGISQGIATSILFSFVYHSRHKDLTAIPTILTTSCGYVIFIYDSVNDIMLKAGFSWKQEHLIYLWAVLNYRLFLDTSKIEMKFKFGYHNLNKKRSLQFLPADKLAFRSQKIVGLRLEEEFKDSSLYTTNLNIQCNA